MDNSRRGQKMRREKLPVVALQLVTLIKAKANIIMRIQKLALDLTARGDVLPVLPVAVAVTAPATATAAAAGVIATVALVATAVATGMGRDTANDGGFCIRKLIQCNKLVQLFIYNVIITQSTVL